MAESDNHYARLGLRPGFYTEQHLAERLTAMQRACPGAERLADATLAYCMLREPERQRRYLSRLLAGDGPSPLAADSEGSKTAGEEQLWSRQTTDEFEAAFCTVVAVLLEGDGQVLRYSNRRRLLDLAARMGIAPFEANLLIERARFRASRQPAWGLSAAPDRETAPFPSFHPRRRALLLVAVVLALLADVVLILYLLPG